MGNCPILKAEEFAGCWIFKMIAHTGVSSPGSRRYNAAQSAAPWSTVATGWDAGEELGPWNVPCWRRPCIKWKHRPHVHIRHKAYTATHGLMLWHKRAGSRLVWILAYSPDDYPFQHNPIWI
ncbi:hypothetical protein V490_04293 [Pseudogymnoascus sp. VKM F-3557]|nr:hypothetical protein V490_04293 [Pseudogymnoascus sp. VKM F-3557]